MKGLAVEFAVRLGLVFHRSYHGSNGSRVCRFDAASHLRQTWNVLEDPAKGLAEWTMSFFDEFERAHPIDQVERAAQILEREYASRSDTSALAERVHMVPSRLVRAFRRRYGMSPKEFQMALRVVEALDAVRREKIDPVALQVGFKSRKGLYRAVEKLTGLTLSTFRTLPSERALAIIEAARRRVVGRSRRS